MFTPVKITPLPRRGSPLALILRGILVAAVVMALPVTLAAYAGSETLGAPLPLGRPRLGTGHLGREAGSPIQTEQTSVVPQPPEGNYRKDSPLSILPDAAGTDTWQISEASSGRRMHSSSRGDISGQESGEAAPDGNVTVNYANQIARGSPWIFGGTQCPRPDQTDAWNKEAEVGVTMLRQDWFLNDLLPNSTVEDYKDNIHNIQDSSTWPTGNVQWIADKFINAQSRGMKLMAIVDYAPHWLTYSGTQYGVPKDWWVWEHIVKKAYLHFRNQYGIEFDYIEVWNEPSAHFLDVTNSGMTRAEAYKAIYYHTWQAIREVAPHVPIGGPADYAPYETEILEAMLQDGDINGKIDFVSYHYYDDTAEWMVGDGPPERFIDAVLQAYGREDIPVMLSEYNASCCGIGRVNSTDESISYIGDKYVWFLKRGFLAANYFSLTAYCGAQGLCYYDWINGQAQLKPQAKTWQLASKKLGFGDGLSKVMETTHSNSISAVGAINSRNQYVVMIANDQAGAKTVTVTLQNLGLGSQVEVEVYLASSTNDATQPVISDIRTVQDGTLSLAIDMPAWSVVGIKLSHSGQPTPTPTSTPTATPTQPVTPTPTSTPTLTPTATPTQPVTPTPTSTPTLTPTATPTQPVTSTPTSTPTLTPTATPTQPSTPTPTATPTDNVLDNGSFEEGSLRPDDWIGKDLTLSDERACGNAHEGSCSFKVVGTGAIKLLAQVLNISGSAGESLTLSGWSRARNPLPTGGAYRLVAKVFHTDGTEKKYRTSFTKSTHGWEYKEKTFTLAKDYKGIVVILRYARQSGQAWFDDVGLVAK